MCAPAILAALGPLAGAGATAAGATAAAATGVAAGGLTLGGILQTVGLITGVAGSLAQGRATRDAENRQAAFTQAQAATEAQLTTTEDQRKRQQFSSAIRKQTAELAARGVALDSPSAILLGQTAAQEMSFESQAVRSGGVARQTELSVSAKQSRARAQSGFLTGVFSAADKVLTAAPDLWPGFTDKRVLKGVQA